MSSIAPSPARLAVDCMKDGGDVWFDGEAAVVAGAFSVRLESRALWLGPGTGEGVLGWFGFAFGRIGAVFDVDMDDVLADGVVEFERVLPRKVSVGSGAWSGPFGRRGWRCRMMSLRPGTSSTRRRECSGEKPPQFMQFSCAAVRPASAKRVTISRRRRKRSASFWSLPQGSWA